MAVVEARGGHYGEMGLSYDKFIKGVQHRTQDSLFQPDAKKVRMVQQQSS